MQDDEIEKRAEAIREKVIKPHAETLALYGIGSMMLHMVFDEAYNAGCDHFRRELAAAREDKASVLDILKGMSDEERAELFGNFCRNCGSDDPRCQCWNDD